MTSHLNKHLAETGNANRIPFETRPEWGTNGHRELSCICGRANVARVFKRRDSGIVVPRVEGACTVHGHFTVTSGEYVLRSNAWHKYDPSFVNPDGVPERELTDLRVGNGLSFNDWLGGECRRKRWAFNEGVHGALARRGLLFDAAARNRFQNRMEAEIAMVLSSLHIRGIEYRRRMGGELLLAA